MNLRRTVLAAAALPVVASLGIATSVLAAPGDLDNGIPLGTVGHVDATVTTGGNISEMTVTVDPGTPETSLTEQVIFDYFTYISTGTTASILSGDPVTGEGNATSSSGAFTGSGGNTINWTVTTALPASSPVITSTFTFTAETGSLGTIRLFQYLDEDLESVSDDVFFTRGSVAGGDLQLFTVDTPKLYGVSHGGAYSDAQGLSNSSFLGWAADEFNQMKPVIEDGSIVVSPGGNIDLTSLPQTSVDPLGTVFGPNDVVSVLAWFVNPEAQTATIVTSIGGVPDITEIPPEEPNPIPLPAGLWMAMSGLALLGGGRLARRRRLA
jgi:hypothetical protein